MTADHAPGATAPDTATQDAAAPGARQARTSRSVLQVAGRFALWVLPIALAVLVWQVLSVLGVLGNEFIAPPPSMVWEGALALISSGELQRGVRATAARVAGSFVLGMVVGVSVGMLIGRIRLVRLALRPLASFLYPFPGIAIYPAMLIIFGPGSASKVAVGFVAAVFPIMFATMAASSAVEPHLEWSARALGASRRSTFVSVVLPASLPGILTGMRIGLVGAIIAVFLGEMISAPSGLGQVTSIAANRLRINEMYAGIIAIALTGLVFDRALLFVRRQLLAWSPEADLDVRGR
jgi:ABC-type nitrate/sulfonate/bicarbonate transport system permease component